MASKTLVPNPTPLATTSKKRINQNTVRRVVKALLKWKKLQSNQTQNENPQQQDDFIYLLLTLKKIPPKDLTNPIKIPLPHPLQPPSSNLCLIIDDRPKPNSKHPKLTSDSTMKKIESLDIPISKILKLTKLKSDFSTFEAKRKLFHSYDVFFADKRVMPLLPKVLGKQFYKKKKKVPLPVDLIKSDWKEEFERGFSSGVLCFGNGTCSVVKVGKFDMESGEIVENVVAAINGVVEVVPKKWAGVRSFHLKFSESLALPIYQGLKMEEVKKIGDLGVKGTSGKDEKMGLKKERINEVRFTDVEDELISDDGNESDKSDDDDDDDDDEMGSFESVGKMRKEGDFGMIGEKLDNVDERVREQ